MSDLIRRADAIEAVCNATCEGNAPYYPECDQKQYCLEVQALKALPSASYEQVSEPQVAQAFDEMFKEANEYLGKLESAEAEPKVYTEDDYWNGSAEEKGWCHRIRPKNVEVVVRCKDCKWYDNRYGDVCHNPRYGDGHANYQPPYVDEDYWCKDGKRKGGEDE